MSLDRAFQVRLAEEIRHLSCGAALERAMPDHAPARSCSRGPVMITLQEIVQKFGNRIDAGYQQMVTGARAGDVKQMPLGIVDVLDVGTVGNALDPFLNGNSISPPPQRDVVQPSAC